MASCLLQSAYLLGAKSALDKHSKHLHCKLSLSLLMDLHKRASAALEAVAQVPIKPERLETHTNLLSDLVRPAIGYESHPLMLTKTIQDKKRQAGQDRTGHI